MTIMTVDELDCSRTYVAALFGPREDVLKGERSEISLVYFVRFTVLIEREKLGG